MPKYLSKLLLLLVLILVAAASCNSIKHLETKAYYGKTYYGRLQAARLLHKKEPFSNRGIEVILEYYKEQKIDSANVFFENLTAKHPNSVEPYLLRETFGVYPDIEKIYRENDIKCLEKVLAIDSVNTEALNRLAELYYDDFMLPLEKRKDYGPDMEIFFAVSKEDSLWLFPKNRDTIKLESRYSNSAQKALYYYDKAWKHNNSLHNTIYFPIKQLQCYLKQDYGYKYAFPVSSDYFPSGHFANLNDGWDCDFTTSYIYKITSAQEFGNDWLSKQLKALKEPALFNKDVNNNQEIYRFTWLRSFHNPIAVRIEKTGDAVYLYYKIGKGMGGYKPEGLRHNGKKKLSVTEWDNFVKLVVAMDYNSLNNSSDIMMMDGAE